MSMIKLGIQTNPLKMLKLQEVIEWAARHDVETLEIPAWPDSKHCKVDQVLSGHRDEITGPCKKHGIEVTSLVYCTNHLAPDTRESSNSHMKKVIEAASQLDVSIVACFIGGTGSDLFTEMGLFEEYFLPLVDFAGEHDVRLAVENCPQGGKNIGMSPYYWREIFEAAEHSPYLGLEFDPSHLVWLHIDYKKALQEFCQSKKVLTIHAKDTRINDAILIERGILGKGWWEYKIPGSGMIDWNDIFKILNTNGYTGSMNIEHEDAAYRGNAVKIKEGFQSGLQVLRDIRNGM
ncbi:TIM barrel protein [Candidatus Bathyarchaeota archaeon]|nr:TIM barrel protein [Candidatus Bathyarchaeota archaeon]